MARGTIQIASIVGAVVLAGAATVTVTATGGGAEGAEGGDDGGFLHSLHKLGQHLHGGGHHHDPMAELVEQLELTPEQRARLERAHVILAGRDGGDRGSMAELHERLMAQFGEGRIRTAEIRDVIDTHVEQIRVRAYAATDELIALVNGLDDEQRETLRRHLEALHEGQRARGH